MVGGRFSRKGRATTREQDEPNISAPARRRATRFAISRIIAEARNGKNDLVRSSLGCWHKIEKLTRPSAFRSAPHGTEPHSDSATKPFQATNLSPRTDNAPSVVRLVQRHHRPTNFVTPTDSLSLLMLPAVTRRVSRLPWSLGVRTARGRSPPPRHSFTRCSFIVLSTSVTFRCSCSPARSTASQHRPDATT